MCGIYGFFAKKHHSQEEIELLANQMSATLHHRGPDSSGFWFDAELGVCLGHTRLSIIDVSSFGSQPMVSKCGQYVITYNGEIYNYRHLRSCLKNTDVLEGNSDTEVLLYLIIEKGIEAALELIEGMFAFVFMDLKQNIAYFARDRFGEKPLYIYQGKDGVAFSSEIKALEKYSSTLSLDHSSVDCLLKYSYIGGNKTIYKEVVKLSPGSYAKVSVGTENTPPIHEDKYWSIDSVIETSRASINEIKPLQYYINKSEDLLMQSVEKQMVSDVPLGAFLSGGIDSSLIVALMQSISDTSVNTYSIGFHDKNYNEAHYAAEVAESLGTNHHELYLTPQDVMAFVPELSRIYDQPFADSSQLPTLMVSRFARNDVTVALTGDSGDELFGGYNRYMWGEKLAKKAGMLPVLLRKTIKATLLALPPSRYDELMRLFRRKNKIARFGDKVHKMASLLGFADERSLYDAMIKTSQGMNASAVIGSDQYQSSFYDDKRLSLIEKMMVSDVMEYMCNDILVKVDRAAMAASLETRVPFLDKELYEFSWTIPLEYKLKDSKSKYILREILSKHIPRNLFEREKAGFGVPIGEWVRNDLREWAEYLLSADNLAKSGLIDVSAVRKVWDNHLKRKGNYQYVLWNVLMFQSWLSDKDWRV